MSPKVVVIFAPGQLWHQNRVFRWRQTEEWEALQRQRSIHEGQNSGEMSHSESMKLLLTFFNAKNVTVEFVHDLLLGHPHWDLTGYMFWCCFVKTVKSKLMDWQICRFCTSSKAFYFIMSVILILGILSPRKSYVLGENHHLCIYLTEWEADVEVDLSNHK